MEISTFYLHEKSLEMAEKVFCPHKKITSRTFIIAGALIVNSISFLNIFLMKDGTYLPVPTGIPLYNLFILISCVDQHSDSYNISYLILICLDLHHF